MKNLNKILIVAALAAMFGLVGSARAQNSVGYSATGEDGITASPKHRQFLNEHKRAASTSPTTVAPVGYWPTGDDGITASPKTRQQLTERKTVPGTSSSAAATVGYRAKSNDGITASPKLRQQLDERSKTFMVAPVK